MIIILIACKFKLRIEIIENQMNRPNNERSISGMNPIWIYDLKTSACKQFQTDNNTTQNIPYHNIDNFQLNE